MTLRFLFPLLAALVLPGFSRPAGAEPLPPVAPAPVTPVLGQGIQRAMHLMAGSTPEHRNSVRVLFYGQSITEQDWWKEVAEHLRKTWPNTDFVIENRAIGGHASQWLSRTAEHQLYPFQPDLLIFHVYGDHQKYEEIIRETRNRTTASILMQTDHVGAKWPQEVPDQNADKGLWWDWMMNHQFLPDIAKKYGCGLADVRSRWVDYLKSSKLEPKALLKDDVHLNADGCHVMAQLIIQQLVHRPELLTERDKSMVQDFAPAKAMKEEGGRFVFEFEGNRLDLVAAGAAGGQLAVKIDGKAPSEIPGLCTHTLPSVTPAGYWPALLRVDVKPGVVLKPEDWTVTITRTDSKGTDFEFEVAGSVTGADGQGNSKTPFVSKSGRVVISPADWHLHVTAEKKAPAAGFKITWKSEPHFADVYMAPEVKDKTRETVVTVAQGLENRKHTAEFASVGEKAVQLQALRVFRPAWAGEKPRVQKDSADGKK